MCLRKPPPTTLPLRLLLLLLKRPAWQQVWARWYLRQRGRLLLHSPPRTVAALRGRWQCSPQLRNAPLQR
jgi:hypothetical protein